MSAIDYSPLEEKQKNEALQILKVVCLGVLGIIVTGTILVLLFGDKILPGSWFSTIVFWGLVWWGYKSINKDEKSVEKRVREFANRNNWRFEEIDKQRTTDILPSTHDFEPFKGKHFMIEGVIDNNKFVVCWATGRFKRYIFKYNWMTFRTFIRLDGERHVDALPQQKDISIKHRDGYTYYSVPRRAILPTDLRPLFIASGLDDSSRQNIQFY